MSFKTVDCYVDYLISCTMCNAADKILLKNELKMPNSLLMEYWITEKWCEIIDEYVKFAACFM